MFISACGGHSFIHWIWARRRRCINIAERLFLSLTKNQRLFILLNKNTSSVELPIWKLKIKTDFWSFQRHTSRRVS